MDEYEAVRRGLAALSQFFISDGTLADTLTRVATLATEAVPGADVAGITMMIEGRPRTGVFTDERSPEIDQAQYDTGIGPCLDAFRDDRVYRVDSTATDERWAAFSKTAYDHGILSTISLPLSVRGEVLGALNLYSTADAGFDESAEELGLLFATQAAVVLTNANAYWDARQLSENLGEAMHSRATIEQAKGILMSSGGRTADEAFQILVRASQRENRKLREIADEIVERAMSRGRGTQLPSEGGGPDPR
jgi:GAF domain-containing protein